MIDLAQLLPMDSDGVNAAFNDQRAGAAGWRRAGAAGGAVHHDGEFRVQIRAGSNVDGVNEVARSGAARRAAARRAARGVAALLLAVPALMLAVPAGALQPAREAPPRDPGASLFGPFKKMPVQPGGPVDARPFPPRAGRARCVDITRVAGAQFFGDRAIELSMRDGRRFRMFFARECQALSFYQGFYYPRLKGGQLCAGRDVIGARSGGECPIASIIPVRRFRR